MAHAENCGQFSVRHVTFLIIDHVMSTSGTAADSRRGWILRECGVYEAVHELHAATMLESDLSLVRD